MKPLCNSKIVSWYAQQACNACRQGAVAELGVYDGATSMAIRQACRRDPQFAFDTFEGMPYDGSECEAAGGFVKGYLSPADACGSINTLRQCGITPVVGRVEDTLQQVADFGFAFVFLDMDLEAPTRFATEFLLPRLLPGGIIGYHDYVLREGYCLSGIARVVGEFFGPGPYEHEITRTGTRDNRFIFFRRPQSPVNQ